MARLQKSIVTPNTTKLSSIRRPPFSYKVVLLLLIQCVSLSLCQNCGVPRVINVKQSDQLRETLDTGQILTSIHATNVARIIGISKNPANFTRVYADASQLILAVNEPLWSASNATKLSYIDYKREKKIVVVVDLKCFDGRLKQVEFRIPIIDENTAVPRFEKPEYHLRTVPCESERCTLVFEVEILVIDEDRDEENAVVDVSIDSEEVELLQCFTTMEAWYEEINPLSQIQKGYQTKVRLSYMPKTATHVKNISFTLVGRNRKNHASPITYLTSSNINITFEESAGRLLPPVFNSPFYYAVVESFGGSLQVKPHLIKATPWDENDGSMVTYKISDSPHVFVINSCSGKVSFVTDIKEDDVEALRNKELLFNITAQRSKWNVTATAEAKLVVFFPSDLEVSPTDSTPWPGTCPPPECPEPDPCPSTTTRPPDVTVTHPVTSSEETTSEMSTTETWAPTHEITASPTTVLPVDPSTEETGFPTEEPSTELPTTFPGTSTEHQNSTRPTPTMPDTSTTSEGTTGWSTSFPTYPSEKPTDATTSEASATTPEQGSSESPTTDPPNTTPTVIPTVEPSTTVEYPIPTREPPTKPQPGNCTCDCSEFSCESPLTNASSSIGDSTIHADPYSCIIYHKCTRQNDTFIMDTIQCPDGNVFCPYFSECTTVSFCLDHDEAFPGKGYGSESDEDSDNCAQEACECRTGYWPEDPRNLCNELNHHLHLPDPLYCDIFHQCQQGPNTEVQEYIDYPMRCQPGQIFCPSIPTCVPYGQYSERGCVTTCLGMQTRQCDVCKMGPWDDFNIFNKTFPPILTF